MVVLKNGRYLIFDNSGRVVRLDSQLKFIQVSTDGKISSRDYNDDDLKKYTIVDTLNVMELVRNYLKLLMLDLGTGEYFTADLMQNPDVPFKSYIIKNTNNKSIQQVSYRIQRQEATGPRGQMEIQKQEYIIKFDCEGNVSKFVYPELVKLDLGSEPPYVFNENDFSITININKNIELNEMIKSIIEKDIKKHFKVREIEIERENGEE